MSFRIDIDSLHALLYLRAHRMSRTNTLAINQTQLAGELRVEKLVVHRVLKSMARDGRITPVDANATGPRARDYVITHPRVWQQEQAKTA